MLHMLMASDTDVNGTTRRMRYDKTSPHNRCKTEREAAAHLTAKTEDDGLGSSVST